MFKINTANLPLVLASTSPRRHALLKQARLDFSVLAVAIDESCLLGEPPQSYALRIVNQKARAANALLATKTPTLVLTADTLGVLDEQILTKPKDKKDAFAMWRLMSGRQHEIWTAMQATLVLDGQVLWYKQSLDKTCVHFIDLDQAQMEQYWATGEPSDKACGYAIQGYGALWVQSIEGNYTNVVGLPLPRLVTLIQEAVRWLA